MNPLKTAWKNRNLLLLAMILVAFCVNLVKSYETLHQFFQKREKMGYTFIGEQFKGIQELIKNTPQIGYYTDRSMDDRFAAAQFAQAQYVLAPTILDLNSIDHPWVIFDYKDKNMIVQDIQTLGLIPVSISSTGICLAKNPKFQ